MHKSVSLNTDDHLVTLLRQGDGDAFKVIYDTYATGLYHAAYNIIRNKEECEDMVQELFADLWLKREKINITSSLKGYLFVMVKNKVLMRIRSKKIILNEDALQILAANEITDAVVLEKDLRMQLNRQIGQLPEKCAEIFKLSRNEQLSNKEIANQLDVSVKTVENQISIALKRLRGTLGDFLLLIIVFYFF
uniref:RNA polymerase sigma-70 factor n=1 Tax=Pedobacter schmidteae TaxID=2201271 RepID=UPI000EB3C2E0|nr:RNA polymerase sigma-70 factor [Pedobacter schmidteae]